MGHPRFVKGALSTNFIADEFPDGFNSALLAQDESDIVLAIAAAVHQLYEERASLLSGQLFDLEHAAAVDWVVAVADRQTAVSVELVESGYLVSIETADSSRDFSIETDWSLGEPLFKAVISSASMNAKAVSVQVETDVAGYRLCYRGAEINAAVLSPRAATLSTYMLGKQAVDRSKFLLSPMPGLLSKLGVTVGQQVKKGDELAVVEAMKMENSLRAIQDGTVSGIAVNEGDSVAVDEVILEFS
jgi:propionyl-CoA carboxylase alpha chain